MLRNDLRNKARKNVLAMPSNVGGCIPYDPEISLQGEDLERFSHVHKELYTRVGLIAFFECLKSRNSLPGED